MITKEQIEEDIEYLTHIIYSDGLSTEEVYEIESQLDQLSNQLDEVEKAEDRMI